MRTGHAMTILGGGGIGVSQKKFWEKKFEKKNLETPWKFGDPPKNWRPPKKLETPLKNWRPPEKLETPPQKNWRPPKKLENPPVDRHTLVKILPWPNFVAAGNNTWTLIN